MERLLMKTPVISADESTAARLQFRREWGLVAFVGLLVAGIIILIQILPTWNEWLQLNNQGVTTNAQHVSQRFVITGSDIRYYVTYSFYNQGVSYEHEQEIYESLYAEILAGAPMTVVYLPDNPTIVHLVNTNAPSIPLTVIAACLVGLSVLVLFYSLVLARR